MTQDRHRLNTTVREGRTKHDVRPQCERWRINSPVPLETFDQERMGIAAKE